ncbi:MAG: S-layer homology domain-containing protein, partial [Clostridiales bacterium]
MLYETRPYTAEIDNASYQLYPTLDVELSKQNNSETPYSYSTMPFGVKKIWLQHDANTVCYVDNVDNPLPTVNKRLNEETNREQYAARGKVYTKIENPLQYEKGKKYLNIVTQSTETPNPNKVEKIYFDEFTYINPALPNTSPLGDYIGNGDRFKLTIRAETSTSWLKTTPIIYYVVKNENDTVKDSVITPVRTTLGNVAEINNTKIDVKTWSEGKYYCVLELGTKENDDGKYFKRSVSTFTIHPNKDAYLEDMMAQTLDYFKTKVFVNPSDKKYKGVDNPWNALAFSALKSYTHDAKFNWDSEFLKAEDGTTFCDYAKTNVFKDTQGVEITTTEQYINSLVVNHNQPAEKDLSRIILSTACSDGDPREYGKYKINLIKALASCAYIGHDITGDLLLDKDGALDIGMAMGNTKDPLSASYVALGLEVANATEAEGYTPALKQAIMKRIANPDNIVTGEGLFDFAISDFYSMSLFPLYFIQDDAAYKENAVKAIEGYNKYLHKAIAGKGDISSPFSVSQAIEVLTQEGFSYDDLCEGEVWQRNGISMATYFINNFNKKLTGMPLDQYFYGLSDLYTGKSFYLNAHEVYMKAYPQYANADKLAKAKDAETAIEKLTESSTTADVDAIKKSIKSMDNRTKALVSSFYLKKLEDTEKAITNNGDKLFNEVKTAIDNLPSKDILLTADQAKIDEINKLQTSYSNLSAEKKALLTKTDVNKLNDAVSAVKVAQVNNEINGLPAVKALTLNDKDKVVNAVAAYNGLTKEQKELVTKETLKKLTDAQTRMAKLEKNKPMADITKMSDIKTGDWYYNDVAYCFEKGLLKGLSATEFGANDTMTRGQFVATLGRYAEIEDSNAANLQKTSFTDVESSQYYAAHVKWAVENGITRGMGEKQFCPDATITREDTATMMLRFAKTMNIKLPKADFETFADDNKIAGYAKDYVYILKAAKVINGKEGNIFDPKGSTLRSEVAAVL